MLFAVNSLSILNRYLRFMVIIPEPMYNNLLVTFHHFYLEQKCGMCHSRIHSINKILLKSVKIFWSYVRYKILCRNQNKTRGGYWDTIGIEMYSFHFHPCKYFQLIDFNKNYSRHEIHRRCIHPILMLPSINFQLKEKLFITFQAWDNLLLPFKYIVHLCTQ